jgi:hypothetical protein
MATSIDTKRLILVYIAEWGSSVRFFSFLFWQRLRSEKKRRQREEMFRAKIKSITPTLSLPSTLRVLI